MGEPTALDWGFLAARIALASVFLVAGVAKLLDKKGFYQSLIDFGVPRSLAQVLRTSLPALELTVGIALLAPSTGSAASFVALALITLFTAVITRALVLGQSPPCRCFGELTRAPIGKSTLARNTFFLALAAFVSIHGLYYPEQSVPNLFKGIRPLTGLIMSAAVSAVLFGSGIAFLLLQVLRQQGRVLLQLEAVEAAVLRGEVPSSAVPATLTQPSTPQLQIGSVAPTFRGVDINGTAVDLQELLASNKPILLFFAHPRCGPCEAMAPEIAAWQHTHGSILQMIVISQGSSDENRERFTQYGSMTVILQSTQEAADAYHVYGTPSAVLIRADGTIGSNVASGAEAIRRLLATAIAMRADVPDSMPLEGTMASELLLKALDGTNVSLGALRGSEILLVFFNPSCGFCGKIQGSLHALETRTDIPRRQIVIIAQGDANELVDIGFKSKVLMDYDGNVSRSFGVSGTPMAVLLDREGRVASEIAAGADAVLALAERRIAVQPAQPSDQHDSTAAINGGIMATDVALPEGIRHVLGHDAMSQA